MLMACWMNKIDINETKCTEGRGWRDSSAEREAQTCRESDILQGAPKRRQGIELDKLPENVNTPMLPDKLLHLKSLKIVLNGSGPCSPVYDTFSLASFLDASPALESFILRIERNAIIHYYDAGGDAYPRGKPAYQHDHLKRVMIAGFRSAKSLIKLVIHILESAPSLECLTLDTTPGGHGRKLGDTSICSAARMWGKCCYMSERALEEANRAVEAASRYIIGRVPSTVEFEVLEPCRQCRTGNQ
uniref:At1g61320/AtMIF1 LRR domain-containing protein n=1 Tax=Aegilops tauschii subsp. strangulata TaxID=200361 RepID=A0A453CQT4_AEGTS